MISRIWHGWTTPDNADRYEEMLKEEIFVGIEHMTTSLLVGYATRYNSTREVAETLRECGLAVDFRPLREVDTLAGYAAVYAPVA